MKQSRTTDGNCDQCHKYTRRRYVYDLEPTHCFCSRRCLFEFEADIVDDSAESNYDFGIDTNPLHAKGE